MSTSLSYRVSIESTVVGIVSIYAFLQLLFYFGGLESTILYIFPVALVPVFFLLRALSNEPLEFERASLLLMLTSSVLFVASIPRQPYPDFYDHTKYLMAFFFYFMGVNSHLQSGLNALKNAIFLLIGLPIFLLIFYWFVLGGGGYYFGSVTFIANRNNLSGVLMAIALAMCITTNRRGVPYLLIPVLMSVGTLGAVVGLLGGFVLSLVRRPLFLLVAALSLAALLYLSVLLDLSFLTRIKGAAAILIEISKVNFYDTLVSMDFAEAAELAGGNHYDASIFWRLKQWLDIVLEMLANPLQLFLGFGFSASETVTFSEKLPHNDWLRILFEGGILSFFLFSIMVLVGLSDVKQLGRDAYVLALGVFIFMLSENLINNFLFSFVLFFALGLARQKVHQRPAASEQVALVERTQ